MEFINLIKDMFSRKRRLENGKKVMKRYKEYLSKNGRPSRQACVHCLRLNNSKQ